MNENELSNMIIGAAIEVHKHLGPGLLESAYEECLCHELRLRDIRFDRQKFLPLQYKDSHLDCGYRLDIVAENKIILEIKACENIHSIHRAQLITYLKLSRMQLGLILNFHVQLMKDGIARIVNNLKDE